MGPNFMKWPNSEELTLTSTVNLNTDNNESKIPILGLGTWAGGPPPTKGTTLRAVLHGLKIGYRLIDTARLYANEREVGQAIRQSGIDREQLFVTTKVWNDDHGVQSAQDACNSSLSRLGLSYLDLFLIHWPVENLRLDTWKGLEKLLSNGKCRAIGVSNYTIEHVKELLENSSITPAVNQVEFSPFLYQRDLLNFCQSNDIQLQAYSPLTRGAKMGDENLLDIVSKYRRYKKTPVQVVVRWLLQRNVIPIPKSFNEDHIDENANVFDFTITPKDMSDIDGLDRQLRYCWDPSTGQKVRHYSDPKTFMQFTLPPG